MASPRHHRTPNVKSRPALPPWKAALLERCEQQVKSRRAELVKAARERSTGAGLTEVLSDLVAEQDAQMRDDQSSTGGLRRRTLSRLPDGAYLGCEAGDDDEPEGRLSEEERLAFLLHLQEELLNQNTGLADEGLYDDDDRSCRADTDAYDDIERYELAYAQEQIDFYTGVSENGVKQSRAGPSPSSFRSPLGRFHTVASTSSAATSSFTSSSALGGSDEDDEDDNATMNERDDGHDHEQENSGVLCPICRRHSMFEQAAPQGRSSSSSSSSSYASTPTRFSASKPVISCRCGYAIDASNGLTLDHLQQALAGAYEAHRRHCPAEPVMRHHTTSSDSGTEGITGLFAHCDICRRSQLIVQADAATYFPPAAR